MTDAPPFRSHGTIRPQVSSRPRPLLGGKGRPGAFRATVLTLFPAMFPGPLGEGVTGRALGAGLWGLDVLDIRGFARDKHRSVDDTPAGGGPGMVLRPDVVASAVDRAEADGPGRATCPVLYLSPRGEPFDQARARGLAAGEGMVLLCGRYEGLDERVIEARGLEEVSLGDFVLTGGEVAAMAVIDAVLRLRPGILGNEASAGEESFTGGLLEHPHYTRPPVWEGRAIPEVLLSGHHARIARWRRDEAERLTRQRRPDLWSARDRADGEPELSDAQTSADHGGHEKD